MELRGPNVSPMHDGGKVDSIVRRCQDDLRRLRQYVVGVNEINKTRFCDAPGQSVRLLRMELVPSHVRHAQVWRQFHDASRDEIETAVQPEFFTLGEEQMHAQ